MKTVKSVISIFFAVLILITSIPISYATGGATSGQCGNNINWVYNENTAELTISGTGEMWDYSPMESPWSVYQDQLQSVVIGNGVTRIGACSFYYCTKLESVTIGSNVKSIGWVAFQYCDSLTNILIPNSVTSIGYHAFLFCSNLLNVIIPKSVSNIGEGAFAYCSSLTSFSVDDNNSMYSSDSNGCLYSRDKTELIQYPVGNDRRHFSIPNSVRRIREMAFYGCNNLTSVTIPNSVSTIDDCAFENCTSLLSVTIPNGVTTISSCTFRDCTSLITVSIPNSVTRIEGNAFLYCSSLASINIPSSVTYIDDYTFNRCDSLTEFTVNENNPVYSSDELGCFYNKDKTELLYYPIGNKRTTFSIPDSVRYIAGEAFANCMNIVEIHIPHGVKSIGENAFDSCSNLKSVTVENGLETIGSFAFNWCSSLLEISIPNSVTSIGRGAFFACLSLADVNIPNSLSTIASETFRDCDSLTSITIPNSITSIEEQAFWDCSCQSVVIPESVTRIDNQAFGWCNNLEKLMILNPSCEIYQNADTINETATIYGYPNSTAKAYADAFGRSFVAFSDTFGPCGNDAFWSYDENTKTLSISGEGEMSDYLYDNRPWVDFVSDIEHFVAEEGITNIGDNALNGAHSLVSVILPSTCVHLGEYAFNQCYDLNSLVVSEGNTVYHSKDNCLIETSSKTLVLGTSSSIIPTDGSVICIGEGAFKYRRNIENIIIPGNIKTVETQAFYRCRDLKSVVFNDGVTTIDWLSFYGCDLRSIIIAKTVNEIDQSAFLSNNNLETITIDTDNTKYSSNGNCIIDLESKTLVLGCNTSVIPSDGSATTIGLAAFAGSHDLPSVSIPNCIRTIEATAFNDCDKLVNVIIPGSVTSLGPDSFGGCGKLESVVINNGVSSIEDGAFKGCPSLKQIEIPKSVTTIGNKAFGYNFSDEKYADFIIRGYIDTAAENYAVENNIPFTLLYSGPRVTGVTLDKTSVTIEKGKTQSLTATITPSNAENKRVSWSSSNTSVATVDKNGVVTAKANGTATITVETNDGGKTASCTVTVKTSVSGVSLDKATASIVVKKTLQLSATVNPSTASDKNVSWSSSNTSVATVSNTGLVTAKAAGTANITVKTSDGGKTATCKVTVNPEVIKVKSVSLNKSSTTIFTTKTEKLTEKINPSNATYKGVTWSSSNTAVATVSNGTITAQKAGTATITVTTNDGSKKASCSVTVKNYNENVKASGEFKLEKGKTSATFDANWLETNPYNYNHELAQFCSLASLLTYAGGTKIEASLKNLGFGSFAKYWPKQEDATEDRNSYYISCKDYTIMGKPTAVVLLMLRGTTGKEWYGNFDPGRGRTHQSFESAANYILNDTRNNGFYTYLSNLSKEGFSFAKGNLKVIVTGHSRGAAVSNLIAKKLDDKYPSNRNSIFCYTFATPNVTKAENKDNQTYNNIYNFVNPEDFVTKLLPSPWHFGRYGITLTLPSKTNESASSYKTYYSNMNRLFKQYRGESYTPYPAGEETVYKVINKMTSTILNTDDFYDKRMKISLVQKKTPYSFFKSICSALAEGGLGYIDAGYTAILSSGTIGACKTYKEIADFFVPFAIIKPYFGNAHFAETYAAFLNSMNYNQAYTWAKGQYRKGYKGSVNCPVDVEIIDLDLNEVVGRITNNVIDEDIAASENSIMMSVDGDSKSFWLPANGNYDVRLIGNDEGTMDYSISEIDSDLGEVQRVNYYDVPVSDDFEMDMQMTDTVIEDDEEGYSDEREFTLDDCVLVNELGETIDPEQTLSEEELQTIIITVETEGLGSASDSQTVTDGDYVSLEAGTDQNNEFLGWYENNELVSSDAQYSFVAKGNRSLIAKFTNNVVATTSIALSESQITVDEGDEETDTFLLDVIRTPANATDTDVVWTSSDEAVATVDDFGVVSLVGPGTTTITAKTDNGITATCNVRVVCKNHSYVETGEAKAATCTEAGFKYTRCSVCGENGKQTIDALGHTKPDENGNCSRCGIHLKDIDDGNNNTTSDDNDNHVNICKWCGKTHEGFFQKIIGFFHKILASILGAKY